MQRAVRRHHNINMLCIRYTLNHSINHVACFYSHCNIILNVSNFTLEKKKEFPPKLNCIKKWIIWETFITLHATLMEKKNSRNSKCWAKVAVVLDSHCSINQSSKPAANIFFLFQMIVSLFTEEVNNYLSS